MSSYHTMIFVSKIISLFVSQNENLEGKPKCIENLNNTFTLSSLENQFFDSSLTKKKTKGEWGKVNIMLQYFFGKS